MKKNLIIIFTIILAIAAFVFYLTREDKIFAKEITMFKAVPVSAPVFAEINSLKSMRFDNQFLKGWFTNERMKAFVNWVEKADTVISKSNDIRNGLRNESFVLVFEFVGESGIFPLIILKAESNGKTKALENLARAMYPFGENNMEEINYNGYKITSLNAADNNNSFHYCFANGLFLASPKLLLVERSLLQLSTQSITVDANFSKVNKTVNFDSEISIYINHATFSDILKDWMNPKSIVSVNEFGETERTNYRRNIQDFKEFAAWSELDVEIDDNEILMTGVSSANDSLQQFLPIFRGQNPVRFRADEILPDNTSFFVSFGFTNKKLFFENLEKYFSHSGSYYKREDKIKKIESEIRLDVKETFQSWVKNEIVVAVTDVPLEPEKKNTFFILETEGKTNAENTLVSLLTNYSQRKKIEFDSLKTVYSVDEETKFTIFAFPFPSMPGLMLGKPFSLAKSNYVAFYNNSLVFCNTKKGLEDYLYAMALDATLAKNMNYGSFKQNIENKTNINSYLNINRGIYWGKEIFSDDISKMLLEAEDQFRKIHAVNWQVINEKEMFFNSVFVDFNSESFEETKSIWKSNIGSQVIGKPTIVINPKNKNNPEILVQDSKYKLHQLTKEGRVRWSVPIEEKIISEIHQVDILGNGNLQYLFNTRSKLYLIDREGNNVDKFPVTFRSPATNGVNVFDYDNNHIYRFFVACEDKRIYAYENEGKIIQGWKFDRTDFPVKSPIQHFRVRNKDYIVFNDQSRIYIQDRRGATRVTTSAKLEYSENPVVLNLNGTDKMVATDINGNVFYIYFDGNFTEIKTKGFSKNHFFTIDDLDDNNIPELIFVDGKEVTVHDESGKIMWNEKFKNKIEYPPGIYSFNSALKKIGIVDAAENRIYLYHPDGKLQDGFPLRGNSEFRIGEREQNSGSFNLIVGGKGGNLHNYLLN